jgi:N-acyl-D-aspartate/D-glutamate deacylase
MLTMTRTEVIPYASMKAGINWDWETIPQYLDSLDRAPKGINCIQYMPTASLMTYVMGLEAAKTRAATASERAEMARLLDEGMDAGLCGFSIQRLGPNSVQADFDGSPMVTDTMCDEDILNLARVLRRRDEGFMAITQGTRDARVVALRQLIGRAQSADRASDRDVPVIDGHVQPGKLAGLKHHPDLILVCLFWPQSRITLRERVRRNIGIVGEWIRSRAVAIAIAK